MDFPEIEKFLEWYKKKRTCGICLPMHYSFGIGGTFITASDITHLQLIVLGVKRLSIARVLALEAFFQGINEINGIENNPHVFRPDVF